MLPTKALFEHRAQGKMVTMAAVTDHTVVLKQGFHRNIDDPEWNDPLKLTYVVEITHENARDLIAFLQEHLPQLAEATR